MSGEELYNMLLDEFLGRNQSERLLPWEQLSYVIKDGWQHLAERVTDTVASRTLEAYR